MKQMTTIEPTPYLFNNELRQRCLRGLKSHMPLEAPLEDRRPAAVTAVLLPDEEGRGCFLITKRATKLRRHSGQWALPGGRLDKDETTQNAALRELQEEVGLPLRPEDVLGRLDDYPTRSGFVISPFVVWCPSATELKPAPGEVAAVYKVPLDVLDGPEVPILKTIPESKDKVIAIPMLDTEVHAPTAAILYQLREVCLWGRSTRVAHFEQPVFAWR